MEEVQGSTATPLKGFIASDPIFAKPPVMGESGEERREEKASTRSWGSSEVELWVLTAIGSEPAFSLL